MSLKKLTDLKNADKIETAKLEETLTDASTDFGVDGEAERTNPLHTATLDDFKSDIKSVPTDVTSGFAPAIETHPAPSQAAHVAANEPPQPQPQARPAKAFDLAKLDESMIIQMPFIKAKGFDVPNLLNLQPKDPSVRFRWVNFKNMDGANYDMFVAAGYQNAGVDDVDQKKTPIGSSIRKEDGVIKFFDVILMKIPVIRLMEVYKENIEKSIRRVTGFQDLARGEAQRQFMAEISPEMKAAMAQQGYQVEFFNPDKANFRSNEAR